MQFLLNTYFSLQTSTCEEHYAILIVIGSNEKIAVYRIIHV